VEKEMKDIVAVLSPIIKAFGFKGSGQNYRKFDDQVVMVINFQKSSGADRFYVNLGVQPLFIPTEGGSQLPTKDIKEYECIFRRRADPPPGMLGWPSTMDSSLLENLKTTLQASFTGYFTPLSQIPGPMTELTPEQFQCQAEDSIFGGNHQRGYLHFARIAFARGDLSKAKAFAQVGLVHCSPSAKSLRAELNQIMKATEPGVVADGSRLHFGPLK
jgi:hypothetical protein